MSPRAVALLERAVIAIDGLLTAPDLASQRAALQAALTRELGTSKPADAAFVNEGHAPCVSLVAVSRR